LRLLFAHDLFRKPLPTFGIKLQAAIAAAPGGSIRTVSVSMANS
jgi:hypothetical protein